MLDLLPRPTGDAAFDRDIIEGNVQRLQTTPEVETGHPFLDLCVKTGLAHVDATFQGNHPKYGVKTYAGNMHDSFPPIIIAAVDALTAWGLNERAARVLTYWMHHFIREDGTIDYYGPSLSEYGQLLHTAALMAERAGPDDWWSTCYPALDRLAIHLLRLREAAKAEDGLISGIPEADTRHRTGKYFHNNAWIAKALRRWADLCEQLEACPSVPISRVRSEAEGLARDTVDAIQKTWPADPDDWWLSPQVEPVARPSCLTDGELASYANYRYWPELLSSEILPHELAHRVVESRLTAGGQFCGMTRFLGQLDDWPLTDYLYGLWALGRKNDFLLSLYGHVVYHQAEGHLTAYEQVTLPPGREIAAYCLPCQLVAPRAARLVVG